MSGKWTLTVAFFKTQPLCEGIMVRDIHFSEDEIAIDTRNDDKFLSDFNKFRDSFLLNHGIFPKAALQDTLDRIDFYTPLLLIVLKSAKSEYKDISGVWVG